MGDALEALENASRRQLQALAKELQLCRGNAKSDVIVRHAKQFIDDHPKDGEQHVLGALGGSKKAVIVTLPTTKGHVTKEDTGDEQPEDEPVKRMETNISSGETKQVMPKDTKDKTKSKHVSSHTATIISSLTATLSAASSKPLVTSPPTVKMSPSTSGKTQPTSIEKKIVSRKEELPTAPIKSVPINPMVKTTARKAVEALVESVADLTFIGESRVRCLTTGHEMLADVDIINTYVHGKRYQKARNLKLSFAKYAPMFVEHPDKSKTDMLWCNVTESAIARDEQRVKDHMAAPKYHKRLPIWKEQEVARKKAEKEENQRRAARIQAAKKMRLETATKTSNNDTVLSERPMKRKRKSVTLDK